MPTVVLQKSLIGMKTNKLPRNILALLNMSFLLLTNGCGLKGDLYIPEKQPALTSPVAEPNDDGETESETQAEQDSD